MGFALSHAIECRDDRAGDEIGMKENEPNHVAKVQQMNSTTKRTWPARFRRHPLILIPITTLLFVATSRTSWALGAMYLALRVA